jgi:hypothetical protein
VAVWGSGRGGGEAKRDNTTGGARGPSAAVGRQRPEASERGWVVCSNMSRGGEGG